MDMTNMTQTQADRIADRTAHIVATMRTQADALEASGDINSAQAMRTLADSRERAGAHARAGARIGRA